MPYAYKELKRKRTLARKQIINATTNLLHGDPLSPSRNGQIYSPDDHGENWETASEESEEPQGQEDTGDTKTPTEFKGLNPNDLDLPTATAEAASATPKLNYYILTPIARNLEWRLDSKGEPVRKSLPIKSMAIMGFMQTRGPEPTEPCSGCRDGKGPWRRCVTGERDKSMGRWKCANCRFSRRHCDLGPNTGDKQSGNSGSKPYKRPRLSCEQPEIPARKLTITTLRYRPGQSEDSARLPLFQQPARLPHSPASRERSKSLETIGKDAAGKLNIRLQPAKPDRHRIGTNNANVGRNLTSRHDGKVLKFPMGKDALFNLPILLQAERDLKAHVERVERRITQLKENEKASWDRLQVC
ncbi:DUF3716 domain-containing protein [Aspergillus mulundensis]|uniref:Uncharacterized protein n=1 Tax=Aspergillus mulundensis TaxID=1810919 RepID=A0A3D8RZD2_9EURO|nr:hypothetical protein DSM5745_06072 [Aspergillus mulundensis]RDW79220.1 hypothetical protein DSM5745_06072 [Aspergillus mulundensis]